MLTAAITATLEAAADGPVTVTGTLRRDDGGPDRFLAALATAHVHGTAVDWAAVLGGGRRVDLPTYAFQQQRYWPPAAPVPAPRAGGDGAGLAAEARFWAAVEGQDTPGLAAALGVDGGHLAGVLPALASWRRQERDRSVTAGWRYQVTWVPVREPERVSLSGTWLLVAPGGPDAQECARALAAHGAGVVLAEAGPEHQDRAAMADLIRPALAGVSGISGIVSLLALDETPVPAYPVVAAGTAATLGLVRALADADVEAPLWVLTRGAVAAGEQDAAPRPVQAMVWGLGQVAALEEPGRWGGLVDLPPGWDERAGRAAVRRAGRVRRGPGRDPRRGRAGPAAGPGPPAPRGPPVRRGPAALGTGRNGAGHRRDRGGRRARGPVAGRAGRAPRGAGQPVGSGRGRGGGPGRRAGRPRDRGGRGGL